MAKKNPDSGRKSAEPFTIDENNIEHVERETLERVNKTITTLESAIASWDAAAEKPADLRPKFEKYKRFRDALAGWESKALKEMKKERRFDYRVKFIREFVDICFDYSRGS